MSKLRAGVAIRATATGTGLSSPHEKHMLTSAACFGEGCPPKSFGQTTSPHPGLCAKQQAAAGVREVGRLPMGGRPFLPTCEVHTT